MGLLCGTLLLGFLPVFHFGSAKLPWSSDHASALDTRTMRETHDVTDSVSASKFDSFHGLSLRAAVRVNFPSGILRVQLLI